MKNRIIRQALRKKVNEWLASIEDEKVRKLAAENTIVTGGAIASMLLGEKVNDYDLYFRSKEAAWEIAKYYIGRFEPPKKNGFSVAIFLAEDKAGRIMVVVKSAGIASEAGEKKDYAYFETRQEGEAGAYVGEVMQDPGEIEDTYEGTEALAQGTEEEGKKKYRPVFMTTNAISLANRIQLVLRFYGEPDVIHENYDFVHCTNYWRSWDGELVLRQPALEALLARELRYVGSKYPICSIFRLRKFIRRGWKVNAGQILKMCMQVSQLDLTDISVLQDQLTGVDCAYFLEVIDKLKEKDPEKVNSAYLVEIIDRMF